MVDGSIFFYRHQSLTMILINLQVWNSYHRVQQVEECFQRSAIALGVDYVDLYLMHWPFAFREGHEGRAEDGVPSTTDVDFLECWRGMEEVCKRLLLHQHNE